MSEQTTETPAPQPAPTGPPSGHPSRPPQQRERPSDGQKRAAVRKPGPRPSRDVARAVKIAFAVVKAERDVLNALAALTGARGGDPEDIAVAAAAGRADGQGLLADVLNLQAASPADGMKTAIRVRSADRPAQLDLWKALTRLGAAKGDPSRNPEELAFAIVEAGQSVPEQSRQALHGALRVLAAGGEG
jgi:hypothetical protein